MYQTSKTVEIMFSKKLNKVILKLVNKKKPQIILIDGISCSGKTFFSSILNSLLKNNKNRVEILSKDVFLKSRQHRISYLKSLKKKISYSQNSKHYDLKKIKDLVLSFKREKNNIKINDLYSRKTGLNNKSIIHNFDYSGILIYEGIYCINDFKEINKKKIRILIKRDLYDCLSTKIKRIRDKKISINDVVLEFITIHLNSFHKYIIKYNYDLIIDYNNQEYELEQNSKISYINKITKFLTKHKE